MQITGLALLISLLLALVGCDEPVSSLNPLLTVEESVVMPGLKGCWTETPEAIKCMMEFRATEDRSYRIVMTGDDGTGEYFGRLVRLDQDIYLDLDMTPARCTEEHSEVENPELDSEDAKSSEACFLVPIHLFFRVKLEGDTLSVEFPRDYWLEEQAKAGTLSLDHAWITSWKGQSYFALTAPTENLQAFLRKNASTPRAFGTYGPFYRRKNTSSSSNAN